MKLPKNFGGGGGFGAGGFGGMMEQMKSAMAAAQDLEENLKNDRITVEKDDIRAEFDGRGQMLSVRINTDLFTPENQEEVEDLISAIAREGFEKATARRDEKVQGILPNIPGLPGM